MTLMQLKRMRSEAEFRSHPATKRQRLMGDKDDTFEITAREVVKMPDLDIQTLLQVNAAMKLMSNVWTMAGAMLVDSKTDFGRASGTYKKVRMIHMSQSISYADFFMRKSMEHPGSEPKVVAWLIDRDRQTRSKARQLFQQGWPWGEALLHSRDVLCQVLWTCSEKDIAGRRRAQWGSRAGRQPSPGRPHKPREAALASARAGRTAEAEEPPAGRSWQAVRAGLWAPQPQARRQRRTRRQR